MSSPAAIADHVADQAPKKDLKHLNFVQNYAGIVVSGAGLAQRVYDFARSNTPAALEPYVARVEDTVVAYAAPAVSTAQDTADKLLHFTDDQVDHVFTTAGSLVNSGKSTVSRNLSGIRDLHSSNMQTYKAATDKYFDLVAKTTDWAAAKLNPSHTVQVAKDTLHATISKALEATDPDVAVNMVYDAWVSFSSIPAVTKVLQTAEPVTKNAFQSFYTVHDFVVAKPLYKKSVDLGSSTVTWATGTLPYKLSKQYLYPVIQPVADPAYNNITKSQVVNKVVDYWKPTVTSIAVN